MTLSSKPVRLALQGVLLLAIVLGGVATRRHVLNAQRQLTADGSIPFSLESALAFRRIQMAYRDGGLPRIDRGIQYPDGVVTREVDTLGVERVYAEAARRWPGLLNLSERIRWLHLLWFVLAIPGMFCWVKWMGGGGGGGLWAAAFYAVAIAAVARSTGQELSHENNALPFLLWHLAADAWAVHRAGSLRARLLAGWAAAVLAALALSTWDLVQFYLVLYMAWGLFRAIRGSFTKTELWTRAVPMMAVLLAAGIRNPYLASHGFLASPVMGLGWGMLLAGAPLAQRQRRATRWILGLAPLALCLLFSRLFLPAYGHFTSLLWAKLRFFNIRPDIPAQLTFDQRILWVPALHSTSWTLLWRWFPSLLVLTAAASWGLMRPDGCNRRPPPSFPSLFFYLLASFAAFILFFRFHVWVAVFACGIVGLWAGLRVPGPTRVRWLVPAFLLAALAVEAWQPWVGPIRRRSRQEIAPEAAQWQGPLFWGRPNVYADETEALMDYLRKFAAPEPVLANFGISASIAAYGGCPVVLHPKFESPAIRDRVREYAETLFTGSEAEFKAWMEAQGATVYVHSMGEFSDIQPGYQMRFMVDALDPPADAAARLFEQRPEELEHFVPQFANRKFRVFRLKHSTVAARLAQIRAGQARAALEGGEIDIAETRAAHALRMDDGNDEARDLLRLVLGLRESGFRAAEDGGAIGEASPLAPADPWSNR